MKITDILNENNIRWLFETTKVVDNVDIVADEILKTILDRYNSKQYLYYTAIQMYDKITKIPHYTIKFKKDMSTLYKNGMANIDCTIYDCTNKQDMETADKNGFLSCKFIPTPGIPTLEINIIMVNGKYSKKQVLKDIGHELTHYYQNKNNYSIQSTTDFERYNKNYDQINSQISNEKSNLSDFSFVCYFFTKSEISANINGLYTELKKRNINKENNTTIYKETQFYKDYGDVLNIYSNIQNSNEWDEFRGLAQKFNFYKDGTILNTTNNDEKFRKYWITFINRMIAYINNSINQIIYKIIQEKE
jgi:hypothetical protein